MSTGYSLLALYFRLIFVLLVICRVFEHRYGCATPSANLGVRQSLDGDDAMATAMQSDASRAQALKPERCSFFGLT
ncbi:hypothetical protein B0T19DRAFT_427480 [Cercophora scortea]|uniref:Uncharacterized protein n=1 Tax=Cercophora scortea TaxID=314031 RepID=A0AAE0IF59_9PEZI|nr:hypothetical protein B0T19DRAFT_427480 [Cercophora scortea]